MNARTILVGITLSALLPAVTAAQGHPAPAAEVVNGLRRHHHHGDWWRIATDSGRLEVRVAVIDADGLSGVTAARKSPPAPERIAWGSIVRIDLKKTHETRGKVTGTLLGLCAGFIPLANGNANTSQPRNWMLVGGAAGYYLGGRLGAGNVHERALYVAPTPPLSPAVATQPESASVGPLTGAPIAATLDSSATDTATAAGSASARPAAAAASAGTASAIAPAVAATPAIAAACDRIKPGSLLRIDGEFGRFCGYASTIGPEGLDGLRVETTQHSVQSPGSLSWDRIGRIDLHGSNAGPGTLHGALVLGVLTGLLGFPLAALVQTSSGSGESQTPEIVIACAASGAVVGALLGAAIGAGVPGWHQVYPRH